MRTSDTILQIHSVEHAREFVGIKLGEGEVNIYLPISYSIDKTCDQSKRKSILKFLKTIKLCKHTEVDDDSSSSLILEGDDWAIDSYVWIIEDYISNGDFLNLDRKHIKAKNGKINWKRTLNKPPLLSNNNFIYLDFWILKMHRSWDLITEIYRYCLNIALYRIGWLYGYNFQLPVKTNISISEMMRVASRELNTTFEDNKQLRLRNILQILGDAQRHNGVLSTSFGTNNYYIAYEVMIDRVFSNISSYDKNHYMPKAKWFIDDECISTRKLHPDTICIVDESMYIIDAKMYSYGNIKNVKNLPSTSDISKQITYGEYASKVNTNKEIYNIFILPYNGDNVFRYGGYAQADWKENIKTYEKVHMVLMNLNYLVDNYHSPDKRIVAEMINTIKNV